MYHIYHNEHPCYTSSESYSRATTFPFTCTLQFSRFNTDFRSIGHMHGNKEDKMGGLFRTTAASVTIFVYSQ
jgi:hypothetical protein